MISGLPCGPEQLVAQFGRIDIYVFDQIARGRITPQMRVLDAGCGGGRNLEYLIRCGADVRGVDSDAIAIERIRALAAQAAPELPPTHFVEGTIADLPFPDAYFEAVICSAVLHFARDEAHFEAMVSEMWRALRPNGVFFARLASTIGIEGRVEPLHDRWHHLPDGSERFLVDEDYLIRIGDQLGGVLLDPLKTTIVQGMRSMTTWVLKKS
ncbi:MAG: class I SAM-dependent methyltransferase [Gemmatimonadota bacterium]